MKMATAHETWQYGLDLDRISIRFFVFILFRNFHKLVIIFSLDTSFLTFQSTHSHLLAPNITMAMTSRNCVALVGAGTQGRRLAFMVCRPPNVVFLEV